MTGTVPRLPAGDVRRNYFSGCIPWTWRLEEGTPRLRVNPQRTSTGGTVNLKECISASGATAVTGPDGVALRENLRDELRETRDRAILEYSEGRWHSHRAAPIQSPIMDGQGLTRAPAAGHSPVSKQLMMSECPTAGHSQGARGFLGQRFPP